MLGYKSSFRSALEWYNHNQISGGSQATAAEEFIRFLDVDHRAFERSNPIGHFTGSGLVLDAVKRKVLFTHHAKTHCWVQLGGHCDGIRDPFFVAWQECYQEGGLPQITPHDGAIFDLDVHEIPEHKGIAAHLHYDVRYLFFADSDEGFNISDESLALAWVDLGNFAAYSTSPSMLRMERKLIEFMELNGWPRPIGYSALPEAA